jgi:hypothetical protein
MKGSLLHAALALALFPACASARLILEKPVAEQCTSSGLEGCPELTEGVLLVLEGNEADGASKLEAGARANEPAKVREFATHVETLTSLPGVSSYTAPIHTVASILARSAKPHAKTPKPREPSVRAARATGAPDVLASGVTPADVDLTDFDDQAPRPAAKGASPKVLGEPRAEEIEGGTLTPTPEGGAIPCQTGMVSPTPMLCVSAANGPIVLTDIHAAGECRADVFVLAGAAGAVRWLVESPARTPLHVTGARLFARADEQITIAVRQNATADSRCAITWSGSKSASR